MQTEKKGQHTITLLIFGEAFSLFFPYFFTAVSCFLTLLTLHLVAHTKDAEQLFFAFF